MKTLLQRNHIWDDDIQSQLSTVVEKCTPCIASSLPQSARKLSIFRINRQFNDLVLVDHFWLEEICLVLFMDAYSRYSTAQPVQTKCLSEVFVAFENLWIGQFWPPCAIKGDLAFKYDEFFSLLNHCKTDFRPVAPSRHYKNLLEPKHGVIRSVYTRLTSASPS